MSVKPLTLIHIQEGSQIVIVCLEHFMASQGDNTEEALEAFWDVWAAQKTLNPKPTEIEPAPQKYWDMIADRKPDGTFRVMDDPDSWDIMMYYIAPLKK